MLHVYTGETMKIINPSFEIIRPHENDGIICLQAIERMARISHRAEDKMTDDSWKRFIQSVVLDHGDWSVVEHVSATVIIKTDRGITHELVRHRLFSFTQESTRFVNYKKRGELEFIIPSKFTETSSYCDAWIDEAWKDAVINAEKAYFNLLELGARPQEARSVLPNCTAAMISMTGNLRSWRWFFLARTTLESHPDMRRVTIPLLDAFRTRIPLLFDDIEPNQKQSISMAKVH
jgi:thymidylate synthase (FAD)